MQDGIILWCNRLIRWGFFGLFGLVPLLLTPWNYELFEYNKMMAVYAVTAIIVTSWIVKSISQKEFRIARTPLDIPIALFVISQLVSSIFSIDSHVSWFGYYSRFNGGMWSIISYMLLFYAFVSNWNETGRQEDRKTRRQEDAKTGKKSALILSSYREASLSILPLIKISLVTGTLVAIYGVLERLGIDKNLWVQDVQNRVFSTLGQPNWLAAYLVALAPLTWYFALQQFTVHSSQFTDMKKFLSPKFLMFSLLSTVYFLTLLFTRSRSGLLGFFVADVVFWGVIIARSLKEPKVLRSLKNVILSLHVVFAVIVFINGTGVEKIDQFVSWKGLQTTLLATPSTQAETTRTAGPALEVGGTESGTIRTYVWQGAVNAWNSSWKTRVIGTGTETFAFAFYEFRPVGHNNTSEWDFLYNKAHNEYLNYLATTGVLGLGSYLLFIGGFIYWFIKFSIFNLKFSMKNEKFEMKIITLALFAGWLSILVTNFFGFSVVTQQLMLFLFPAIIFVLGNEGTKLRTNVLKFPSWTIWIPVVVGFYVLIKIGLFWYADTLYAKAYRQIRGGVYGTAIPSLTTAIAINPSEPTYHDELASGYATLAAATSEGSNATQAAQLASLAIEESNTSLRISPHNVNYYKTRTKVYYTLSALEPTFNAKSVEALMMAIPLSPNDPKIYYNLAILVGRDGDTQKAIDYLATAKHLKPNYRDVYYALWVFYNEENKTTDANAILQEYLDTIDPNDKDFLERLKN